MANKFAALELHGYKTFANQISFEFPANVTAIVGPNGSGKSNITDSIRWVLGEQSYSLLRAKRTEDMIFSGSDSRSRAGMASVSIKFDNQDNWLPIDYAEVVLTRRAYRDGQNDYLINNQRVRLKDFHELLAQTGLSDRTYTIIGQGLVDLALSIKPDERRKLFEEAAGIGLFRSRKEETIRRLEATDRNLDRISDILSEIKPRLRNLERQAKRAREHKDLEDSLKIHLQNYYGFHWFKTQEEFNAVELQLAEQEQQLSTARERVETYQAEQKEIEAHIASAKGQLDNFSQNNTTYQDQIEAIAGALAIISERKNANTARKQQLIMDLQRLESRIQSRENVFQSQNQECTNLEQEYQQAQQALAAYQAQFTQHMAAFKQKETEFSHLKNEKQTSEIENVRLSARKTAVKEKISSFQKTTASNHASIQKLETELKELTSKTQATSVEIQSLTREADSLSDSIKAVEQELSDLLEKDASLKQKINALAHQKAEHAFHLDLLQQSETSLTGFSNGAKSLLDLSNKKATNFIFTSLNRHLIVPEKYNVAIAAALDDLIDVLLLENAPINLETIQSVASYNPDRVALIQQNTPKTAAKSQTIAPQLESLIISRAIDLVEIPEKYHPYAQLLLQNIFIVKDEAAALESLEFIQHHQKIVTLDGKVFYSNGVVVLGKKPKSEKLDLPRKKRELSASITQIESQITENEKLSTNLKTDLETKQNTAEHLYTRKNELEQLLFDKINHKSLLELEQSKIQDRISWLKLQNQELEENASQAAAESDSIDNLIAQNNQKIIALEEKINALQSSIAEIPVQDLQNELHQHQTHALITKQAFENLKNAVTAISDNLSEDQHLAQEYHNRLKSFEQTVTDLDQEAQAKTQEKEELKDKIEQLNQEHILPQRNVLKDLEQKLEALLLDQTDAIKNLSYAERTYSQIQIDQIRKKDKAESLREKIINDLGIVDFQYTDGTVGPKPLPFEEQIINTLTYAKQLPEGTEENIKELKTQMRRIGAVNPEALTEYTEVKERHDYLQNQVNDLKTASNDLRRVMEELDDIMKKKFLETFKAVNQEFNQMFSRLFNGGSAKLLISDQNNPIEGGIDIEARLPGRREQGLVLLSGGERSLTAVALIFALLKISPTPFCVLDEVDAMLDESNVGRFIGLLQELSQETQFILITHNRNTVQAAEVIYGVTMGRDTTSQVISLKLDDIDEKFVT